MKIIIHGGFFSESATDAATKKAKQDALKAIAKKGFEYLHAHTALETVVYTVSLLEDDPLFNAGIGSQIQSDGHIRMSAAVMDGVSKRFSGVINVENVRNPIFAALKMQQFDDRVLGGEPATLFVRNQLNIPAYSTEILQRRKEYEEKLKQKHPTSTVGCVAIDNKGNLATATSTGGKGFEIPGRISDSATVAGNYANEYCAVSTTGVGEDIVSGALAAKIVTRVTDGMDLEQAFSKSFNELKAFDGFAGAIAIDKYGNIYHQDSHPSMVFAAFDGVEYMIFD